MKLSLKSLFLRQESNEGASEVLANSLFQC